MRRWWCGNKTGVGAVAGLVRGVGSSKVARPGPR